MHVTHLIGLNTQTSHMASVMAFIWVKIWKMAFLAMFCYFFAIMSDAKIQLAKIFFVCDPSNQSASTDTLHGLCDGMNMGQNGTIGLFGHVLLFFCHNVILKNTIGLILFICYPPHQYASTVTQLACVMYMGWNWKKLPIEICARSNMFLSEGVKELPV